MIKLNAKQLRELEEKRVSGELRQVKRIPIFFILENIYDTYNIGGLFRLADAIAAEKIYLCGDTEIPPNTRIKKASIGTYKVVDWKYKNSVKDAIEEIKKGLEVRVQGLVKKNEFSRSNPYTLNPKPSILAVEQHPKATDYRKTDYRLPLALVFGNESYGISKETLELVDQIVEIPMWGINKSLNVIVAGAIVSYHVMGRVRF